MREIVITSITPAIGMLSAFIAILIGQSIDEKHNLKESRLFLLVVSIAMLLALAFGALLLALVGGEK